MKWPALILAAAVVAVAADAKNEASKNDLERLQGTWKVSKMRRGGADAPKKEVQKLEFTFAGNQLTVTQEGRDKKDVSTIALDATRNPKTLDVKPEKKDERVEAIYELTDDMLKVCWNKPGKGRPKQFAADKGSEAVLMEFQRHKK
jgi:uncharacterized protein (TIGR03067 family)